MSTSQDHIIEWFALGASVISCIYHAILYIHQRDRFLLLYANYLFSVSIYIIFKRATGYETFDNTIFSWEYVADHPLILYMLFSYVLFITNALELNHETKIAKKSANLFYATILALLLFHFCKIIFTDEVTMSRTYFFYSKLVLTLFAFTGLLGAWYIRKNTFKRIIISGGLVFAFLSLMTMISVYFQISIFGLKEYSLYFTGCLSDILIFSSALGYRNALLNKEKLQTQELLTIESEKNKSLLQLQHDSLKKESELQESQMKLNRELQNEVGANLSSVHVFADLASKLVASNPDKSKEYLAKISLQSQQLMDDIGDILWALNVREVNAHEALLTRIRNYGHEILNPHQIECTYDIDTNFYKTGIDSEQLKKIIIQIKSAMKQSLTLNPRKFILHLYFKGQLLQFYFETN